jgi:hypothetical protein
MSTTALLLQRMKVGLDAGLSGPKLFTTLMVGS